MQSEDRASFYARRRRPGRVYASRTFPLPDEGSADCGQPARYIQQVYDQDGEIEFAETDAVDVEDFAVPATPGGRVQLTVQVVRQAGHVRRIFVDRVPRSGPVKPVLKLSNAEAEQFLKMVRLIGHVPINGTSTVRLDEQLLRDLFNDPDAIAALYRQSPASFRSAISGDAQARDLIALAYRRTQLQRFQDLLQDSQLFAAEAKRQGGGERVWQLFFEQNPWILGVSLSGQLMTSYDPTKLEKAVQGHSIAGPGKRIDALLRTEGSVRSLVLAEIKRHDTQLLESTAYRPGCWSASKELSGGVTQAQLTAYAAERRIDERLAEIDEEGGDTGAFTYAIRPRAFLVIGMLDQLSTSDGRLIQDKHRCFEIFRRSLQGLNVITFDELLARARWQVDVAEDEAEVGPR